MSTKSLRPGSYHSLIRQRGFSLVELMISLTIGLFMLAGMATIFSSTQISYTAQNNLTQLQDNEILAMNILGNVLQSTGYFPAYNTSNQLQSQIAALPALAAGSALPATIALQTPISFSTTPTLTLNFSAAQSLYGGSLYSSGPDAIAIRSMGAMDCTGNTTANTVIVSIFTVNQSNNYLLCSTYNQSTSTQSNWQVLVTGVNSMSLLYGLDPNATGSATEYVTAANVANWSNVISVRVSINFVNPLYNASAPLGQAATVTFSRVIGIMGMT